MIFPSPLNNLLVLIMILVNRDHFEILQKLIVIRPLVVEASPVDIFFVKPTFRVVDNKTSSIWNIYGHR